MPVLRFPYQHERGLLTPHQNECCCHQNKLQEHDQNPGLLFHSVRVGDKLYLDSRRKRDHHCQPALAHSSASGSLKVIRNIPLFSPNIEQTSIVLLNLCCILPSKVWRKNDHS